jgi:hypothetical protein
MYLYNITVGIDKSAETFWLQWAKEKLLPKIMASGYFVNSTIYKVLHDQDEETTSYSIQLFANTIEDVLTYLEKSAPEIMNDLRLEFKDRHVAFQTLLEEVR